MLRRYVTHDMQSIIIRLGRVAICAFGAPYRTEREVSENLNKMGITALVCRENDTT